jgi:hypothetical protein
VETIGIRLYKPKKFFEDSAEKHSFGSEEGKYPVAKVETELRGCKDGESSCSCSVGTGFAVSEDVTDQVEVLVFFVLLSGRIS